MTEEEKGVEQPEGTPSTPSKPAGTPEGEQSQSWTPEEQAANTRKFQELSQLTQAAKAEGFDSAREYVEYLQQESIKHATQLEERKPAPQPAPKPSEQEPFDAKAFEERSNKDRAASLRAVVEANYATFKLEQSELPKEEQTTFTRKELNKYINDNSDFVARMWLKQMDEDGDGNYYKLAAKFMKLEKGESKKPEGEPKVDTEAAEVSAKLATATAAPAGEPAKTDEQKEADDIAPDAPPYEMPT